MANIREIAERARRVARPFEELAAICAEAEVLVDVEIPRAERQLADLRTALAATSDALTAARDRLAVAGSAADEAEADSRRRIAAAEEAAGSRIATIEAEGTERATRATQRLEETERALREAETRLAEREREAQALDLRVQGLERRLRDIAVKAGT